jgi:hypothetical protein
MMKRGAEAVYNRDKTQDGNYRFATGSCEYMSPILYAAIYIAKRITKKGITMDPQFEVVGEEASGRVIT